MIVPRITVLASLVLPSAIASSSGLRGEVQTIIEQTGVQIDSQEIEICASQSSMDCHIPGDKIRCVYCPTNPLDEDESLLGRGGVCFPAAIFALACPMTSRSLL
jgi:hypothetical protein